MDRLSALSLQRFNNVCPYLGRTKPRTIRSLSTATSTRYPSVSRLAVKATQCPVMGPVISLRSNKLAAGYASVAGASPSDPEVHRIHEEKGIHLKNPTEADVEKCPHASAARRAAQVAADLAAAKKATPFKNDGHAPINKQAAAAGCPFHGSKAAAQPATPAPAITKPTGIEPTGNKFNYEQFYVGELDKKHKDASYRYFNNINRLATKFPVAHTGNMKDEVEVWCANDYLGMGNNPVVLETMQYVGLLDW